MSRRTRNDVRVLARAVKAGSNVFILSLAAVTCVFSYDAAAALQQDGRKYVRGEESRVVSQTGRRSIMTTADLVELARIKTMEIVGEQSRQSLPVPLMRKEGLYVLFFYYPARAIPRQSSKIFTPHYLLSLRADGTFDELRAVTSKDFSQLHRADEIVGTHGLPEGLTLELYYQNLAQLYEVYDVLMPQFGAGRSAIGPEIMSAAKEFRDFFGLISETPLKPYYDFLGTGFFEWIAQASERRSRHQNLGRGHLPASSFIADDLASTTGPVVLGPRNIEDDVAIAEEQNNIVGEIVEQQDKGRFEISFCHLAAVYFLRKDSPKSSDWLALLKKSLSEERPVNFHHVVGWQQITYVELAQRQRSRSFGDQVQEMSAFRMRTGPVDRRPSRK